jgi:glycosyltransferase involved in cell wall biosynthesis
MKEADVFVLSSKWEGFGNVLVEALASGCQVVSTNCQSGPSEILKNGKYGFLVPVDDSNAIKLAVDRIINGGAIEYDSIEALSSFRFKKIGDEYVSIFKKLRNFN